MTIFTVKGDNFPCIILDIKNLMQIIYEKIWCLMILDTHETHLKEIKNRVYNYYFDYIIRSKKIRNKNILIYEKKYTDLVIYFARLDH